MQQHWRSLKTDKYLRVQGTNGSIFALGDAATVEQVRPIVGVGFRGVRVYRGFGV